MGGKRNQYERVLDLVGQVYDAALDENLWSSIAPAIAETFDSTSAAIGMQNMQLGTAAVLAGTENCHSSFRESYAAHYAKIDVWAERAKDLGISKTFSSRELISDREFERTEIYNDWCTKLGIFYMVGAILPITGDEIAVLGIHRPRNGEAYKEADKKVVTAFWPHLRRALQLRGRLREPAIERQAALGALERSGTATIVATRDGRVLYANRQAETLLRKGDAVRAIHQRLATNDRRTSERLTMLIRNAADTAAGKGATTDGALAIARDERLPVTVLVAPFRPAREGFGAPLPAAILFIRDPERPTPASLALQGLFGLTPAEANIASALGDGKAVEEIIHALGITLNTARTHLKSIYAKTNTTRQAQLVALILRSVAAFES